MKALTIMLKSSSRGAIRGFGCGILALGMSITLSGLLEPASASTLGDAIASFAKVRMDKCVDRDSQTRPGPCPTLPPGAVGDGECTDLVYAALRAVNAKPPTFAPGNYVWGQRVFIGRRTPSIPPIFHKGDVIQFWSVAFRSPDGGSFWGTGVPGHHTAIIVAARWPMVTVLEQNNNGIRAVTQRTIDLSWLQSGRYFVYRPESVGPMPIPYQTPNAGRRNPNWTKIL